jgi:serine/threonine-protein kinase
MSSATPLFRAIRIILAAFGPLFFLPLSEAQVTSVPYVVVNAQIGFALTAAGSPVNLANPSGVAIAPDGTIYVADSSNSRIVEIETKGEINESPATTPARIGATAAFLIPSEGLSNPNAIAVGPDGTLYFSDAVKKTLYRVSNPKSDLPVYTQLIYSPAQTPNALAVDPSGNLWVADAGLKEIVEFSPGATSPGKKASVSPMVPTGIAVSASSLYFADANTHAVYGQGAERPLLTGFAGTGFDFAADQAAFRPTGLALDAAGNLFVLDATNKRLVEVNPNQASTAFLVPFAGLDSPASLAVGPTGNLYLTSRTQQELTEFVYNGNAIDFGVVPTKVKSSTVTLNYSFNSATSTTRFYQSVRGGRTTKFSFDNNVCIKPRILPGYSCQEQFHLDHQIDTPGLHKGVVALSDEAGSMIGPIPTQSTTAAPIIAFYPGSMIYLSQGSGSYPTLREPQALAVTGTGSDLFVADEGGTLSADGNSYTYAGAVWDYPAGTNAPTQIGKTVLVAPSALAISATGDLYIADYSTGTISIAHAPNWTSLTVDPLPAGTLQHPISLAFDTAGNLYIGDAGSTGLFATSSNPGFVVKVPVTGSPFVLNTKVGTKPVIFPQSLTTDTNNNLYIADGGDGQTTYGGLVLVPFPTPANPTPPPSYIASSYSFNEPTGLGFDQASDLYVLDGYNQNIVIIPITAGATPTIGTPSVLQTLPIATGSSLVVWPSGQQITVADLGYNPSYPSSQVISINTQTAAITFGPIPLGSSQMQSVTAVNVGNQTATFKQTYSETSTDTTAFKGPSSVCSGGIAPRGQCTLSFTYKPDQVATTTAQFGFSLSTATTPGNFVNATGTGTKLQPTVTLTPATSNGVFNAYLNFKAIAAGSNGTPTGTISIYDETNPGAPVLLAQSGAGGDGAIYPTISGLSVGTHYLEAVYSGDGTYLGATSTEVTVTITAAPTNLNGFNCNSSNGGAVGGNIICGAGVSAGTSPQPSGYIIFTVNGTPNQVALNTNDQASFQISNTPAGTYTITASYPAQGNYAASSSSPTTITVK